ncbi:hypothetical protein [Plantactinospora endophytica]|uniref:Uncharacterized protein n=1 Tax=Plantactinospora endophytica TaxID=673535 RepID=A0ABQ4E6E3_9ACTN|nr:hypothetical protein [Plantactinospora endophytica]GIG90284.1 hypothetical protein Pen02_52200 [Plantactinospora endophytica]
MSASDATLAGGIELAAYVVRVDYFFAGRWLPLETRNVSKKDAAGFGSARELAKELCRQQELWWDGGSFRIQVWRPGKFVPGADMEAVAQIVHRERLFDLRTYAMVFRRHWPGKWASFKDDWKRAGQDGQRQGAEARERLLRRWRRGN